MDSLAAQARIGDPIAVDCTASKTPGKIMGPLFEFMAEVVELIQHAD
jgi:hypothetical protein